MALKACFEHSTDLICLIILVKRKTERNIIALPYFSLFFYFFLFFSLSLSLSFGIKYISVRLLAPNVLFHFFYFNYLCVHIYKQKDLIKSSLISGSLTDSKISFKSTLIPLYLYFLILLIINPMIFFKPHSESEL